MKNTITDSRLTRLSSPTSVKCVSYSHTVSRNLCRIRGSRESSFATAPASSITPSIAADRSTQSAAAAAAAPSGSTSQCPFLNSIPKQPPMAKISMMGRLTSIINPERFQREALATNDVVTVPALPGMVEQLVVGNGDLAKTILAGRGDHGLTFSNNSINPKITAIFGEHALVMIKDVARHKYLRNLITPAYTPEAIASLVPRMEAVVRKYLQRWAATGLEVKAYNELKLFTFEFIVAVVLGHDFDDAHVATMMQQYKDLVGGILAWPYLDLPLTSYGRAMAARRKLVEQFQATVDEARQQLAAGQRVSGVIGSLITAQDENGNRLTDIEITDNLLLVLLAGFDTSSTTLTCVMANLQQHPGALEKLQQEQAHVLAKHGDRLTAAVLKDMPYAEAVIRETLRLTNVVSALEVEAAKDFTLGDYSVTAGSPMYIPMVELSRRDPRWLADAPEQFRPERMMTPEGQKPGWLMPFGHAPRYCVGATLAMSEMKVFLALLVRGYDFSCDTNTTWAAGALGKVPKNGLPMTVTVKA